MAEIPVERKSGIPWWVYLLLALSIVGLAVWLFSDNDPEVAAVAPVTTEVVTMSGVDATGPITELVTIAGAADGAVLAGRSVQLSTVPVQEVVSDAGFWVGSSPADRVYVVLDEQPSPDGGVEGQVNVNAGQIVTLNGGTVRSAADGSPVGTQSLPPGVRHFIHIPGSQVEILQRP